MSDAEAVTSSDDEELDAVQDPALQSNLYPIPSLEALNEELSDILRDPIGEGVARTDAQRSVLGNVRAAYMNQDQIPIPSDTSAARGAHAALMAAVKRVCFGPINLGGDVRPDASLRVDVKQDANGLLNPMCLFEDDMDVALYPSAALEETLSRYRLSHAQRGAFEISRFVLIDVELELDYDTWMATFAR